VRSALLDVAAQVERLLSEGWVVMADMRAAVHGRASRTLQNRVRRWEASAERVLFELLAALELNAE
jgi:hypothetical protein